MHDAPPAAPVRADEPGSPAHRADEPSIPARRADEPSIPARRPLRSFVLRGGRMGSGQQRALAELGPRYTLPFQQTPLALREVFGRTAPCVLEIGFGMGDATAQVATAMHDHDFIGVEVHEAGVGALLKRIGEASLGNLRIVQHDAVEVLQHMIPPDTLAGVHLWFPDPWHKKRHHKRRLVQPPFVALVASRIAPGGYLHCATDWQPYAEQMREVLSATPALRNTSDASDAYANKPAWRPQTKFETRGLKLGHGVWDLVFQRIPRDPG